MREYTGSGAGIYPDNGIEVCPAGTAAPASDWTQKSPEAAEFLVIQGGRPLEGELTVQGAKNSVLPILAASLLCRGQVLLRRCPRLLDVDASIRILRALGCRADWEGEDLVLDTASLTECVVPARLMGLTRSSVLFLGAILARLGCAACSLPGGDELGPRPINLHLRGLRLLGASIREQGDMLHCAADGLRGRTLSLPMPSVGATENLMLAACGASGTTRIENAAREPEIQDLQNFLNVCGGEVRGAGSPVITVQGGRPLHGGSYTVMPDRIAAATYLCAAAAAGGEVCLRGVRTGEMKPVLDVLRACGCVLSAERSGPQVTGNVSDFWGGLSWGGSSWSGPDTGEAPGLETLRCVSRGRPRAPGRICTAPYPGFPTDAQAVMMAALVRARGCTVFRETLFSDRFRHAEGLRRMGAHIRVTGRTAVVQGVPALRGADVCCTDLRGGAALCVAALGAEGVTRVEALRHIDRGYEDLARDLRHLGGDVRRICGVSCGGL